MEAPPDSQAREKSSLRIATDSGSGLFAPRQLERIVRNRHVTPIPNACTQPIESDLTDAEALSLAQRGDEAGFKRLYELHRRRVYAVCIRMVTNPVDAEDLTQEAFMQAFRKLHTFRGESRFSTWLHQLTVNIVLMRFRKLKHSEFLLNKPAGGAEPQVGLRPERGAEDLRMKGLMDRLSLRHAVEQLPGGYRQMFILHDVEGYHHSEIAELLGCSIGNSKSQLHKARLMLRRLLRDGMRRHASAAGSELARTKPFTPLAGAK